MEIIQKKEIAPTRQKKVWHLEIKSPKHQGEKKHYYYGSLRTLFAKHDNLGVSHSKVSKESIGFGDYEIETETSFIRKSVMVIL